MTNAAQTFNAHAADYDEARRRLIPPFDRFYGTALEAVALANRSPARILDLGAGTGLLSSLLRQAYPAAHITLLDGAARMLEQARASMGEENLSYVEADMRDPLPSGSWDAVVSALAVHHLGDDDKRALMGRIHRALSPGGVFVNADQVAGPSARFDAVYAQWHETRARGAGSDDGEWQAAEARMAHDRCATVEHQLRWLRDAGFGEADCLFKDHRFAVMVAVR